VSAPTHTREVTPILSSLSLRMRLNVAITSLPAAPFPSPSLLLSRVSPSAGATWDEFLLNHVHAPWSLRRRHRVANRGWRTEAATTWLLAPPLLAARAAWFGSGRFLPPRGLLLLPDLCLPFLARSPPLAPHFLLFTVSAIVIKLRAPNSPHAKDRNPPPPTPPTRREPHDASALRNSETPSLRSSVFHYRRMHLPPL